MPAVRETLEPFRCLLERFGVAGPLSDVEVATVSFSMALEKGTDPLGILLYLASIGIEVRCLEDMMRVNEIADEEELSAHRVVEGVAITGASQGDWVLFLAEPS